MINAPEIRPATATAMASDPYLAVPVRDEPSFEGAPEHATVAYWEGWAFVAFDTTVRAYDTALGAIFLADARSHTWEQVSG